MPKLTEIDEKTTGFTDNDLQHVVSGGSSWKVKLLNLWTNFYLAKVNALNFLGSITTTGSYFSGNGTTGTPLGLTVDATPTDGSGNPVSSNGTFDAIATEAAARTSGDAATLVSANAYTDTMVTGLLDLRDAFDFSVNAYPTTGGSGTAGAVVKGDFYPASVGGSPTGRTIAVGDAVYALVNTPGQTAANWGYIPSAFVLPGDTALLINISSSDLLALITASTVNPKAVYRITDAVSATCVIRVAGRTNNTLVSAAFKEGVNDGSTYDPGYWGTYDIGTDLFESQGGVVEVTVTSLKALLAAGGLSIQTCYRILDAAQGTVRVYVQRKGRLTATAMLEGSDSGVGSIIAGEWGNYDLDADVFTATVPYLLAQLKVGQFTYDTIPTLTTLCNQFGGTFAITDATDWSITILRTGGISITGDAFAQISVALIGAIPLPVFAQSSALDSLGGTINFLQYDGAVPPTTDPIDSFVVNIYGYA